MAGYEVDGLATGPVDLSLRRFLESEDSAGIRPTLDEGAEGYATLRYPAGVNRKQLRTAYNQWVQEGLHRGQRSLQRLDRAMFEAMVRELLG